MLNYKKIISRLLDQNIYILSNDDKEAIIIDPGLGFDLIDRYLKSENLSPIAVWLLMLILIILLLQMIV